LITKHRGCPHFRNKIVPDDVMKNRRVAFSYSISWQFNLDICLQ